MVAVRKHVLTELEILGAGFLQRWRAYGASDAMDERGGHKINECQTVEH